MKTTFKSIQIISSKREEEKFIVQLRIFTREKNGKFFITNSNLILVKTDLKEFVELIEVVSGRKGNGEVNFQKFKKEILENLRINKLRIVVNKFKEVN